MSFSKLWSFFIEFYYFCSENRAKPIDKYEYEEDYSNACSHHDDYIECSGTDSR